MVDPTTIAAIIGSATLIFTTFIKVASEFLGKCKNKDNTEETAPSAQSGTADNAEETTPSAQSGTAGEGGSLIQESLWRMGNSESKKNYEIVVAQLGEAKRQLAESKIQLAESKILAKSIKTDGILRLLKGRVERMNMEIQSLHGKICTVNAEQLDFEKRADEAISTYSSNVQLIMLVHCLGSVILLVNFPYAGAGVSLVMVLSFFSVFINAYIATNKKFVRMSEFEGELLSRQRDLQNEVTRFQAKMDAPFSAEEHVIFAKMGALNGLMECIASMQRGANVLQKGITGLVELSNSKNIRMKSRLQVGANAIIYGICFPVLAYFILCLMGFRGHGLSGTMQSTVERKMAMLREMIWSSLKSGLRRLSLCV